MREESLERLTEAEIEPSNVFYLVYRYFHADLKAMLKKYSNGRLLDIGCGNKPYQPVFESLIDEYIGCDIVQSSKNCVNVICEATDIPLESNTFDTAISTQVVEHVAEHQKMINEAYRLLKPQGYFIISGPMYWPLHEEPYDFFRFTKHGFKHILEKAGFVIIEEKANGGKWALAGQALIHALYPDTNTNPSYQWKLVRKILKKIIGIKRINNFFAKMDDKHKDEVNTMNYVFVAQKK